MKYAKVKHLHEAQDSDWYNGQIGKIIGQDSQTMTLKFKDGVQKSYKLARIERTYEAEELSQAFLQDFQKKINDTKNDLYADFMELRRKFSSY